MARLLFPAEDPLGRAVELRGVRGERRVAAVVEDMRVGSPRDAPAPILFEPLGQRRATGDYTVLVRTTGDPKALVPAIRRTLREVAPALPMFDVQTLRERVRRTIAEERTLAGVGAALAALGVLMAGLAIFGILEWAVATREREIGVRMALGAQARRVVGHVAAQALAMIGVGAIVGLPLAWVLARALRSQLFDVTPWDPIAWSGSAVVLLAVAALAAVRPAHRATRADPAEALRAE
jgi:ABC-type antimicrobial peptide transport system permease subunit